MIGSKITDKLVLTFSDILRRKYFAVKKRSILSNPAYTISIGDKFVFNFLTCNFEISPNAKVNIENSVIFRDFCSVMVYENAKLRLGRNVFFNRYCSINCLGNIDIGDYSIFGEGVKLYDHNHMYSDINEIIQNMGCTIGSIKVGRNCWVGANVTILNNVTIGDNVIIGANNLIYKDVPSNVVIKSKTEQIINNRLA